jgi:hypothetical protein
MQVLDEDMPVKILYYIFNNAKPTEANLQKTLQNYMDAPDWFK